MNSRQCSSILLLLIVAVYVAIGVLYAALTPTWQVPDEPAHYNYIRALAEGRGIPVIEPGDYDQAYLARLTTDDFPPELSIESLEYEDHQPPLYYLLATPIYLFFGGAVLPLRLISVVFGVGLLFTAFGTLRAIFPRRPELALTATAFIAFIPQHVAMTAGVNNDALAELLVGAMLWMLAVYVDRGDRVGEGERPWLIGLLLAVVLLTKTTAYVVLGVAAGAVVIRRWREGQTWEWAVGQLAWMFVPALLLSLPWFVRNGFTYGWHDPLGLARHNAIVKGQPRSAEWLAAYGWGGLSGRLARTTFQSFWGQFGWMKVVLPARIYRVLALFSALLAAGFVAWFIQRRRPSQSIDSPTHQSANPRTSQLFLLTISALLTFLSYVWYNLTFVQHQGRYLFPALVPIGAAVALGLSELVKVLPNRVRAWAMAAPFVGLAALDLYCLFKFVIPFLER
jgi:4-amino-4-deoxy-L-arabinose transferase-like glycosyltransferase